MRHDPRIESAGHHLCHVLGENRGVPMTDKDRHDVFHTVRHVADYWKRDSDRLRAEAGIRNFNEVRLWCLRNQPDNAPLIEAIEKLMSGGSIR
jgi:hypothetical protein